jgi:hypothetical protein
MPPVKTDKVCLKIKFLPRNPGLRILGLRIIYSMGSIFFTLVKKEIAPRLYFYL